MSGFKDFISKMIPSGKASASPEAVDSRIVASTLVSKFDYVLKESNERLRNRDWARDLQQLLRLSFGIILAALCIAVYYNLLYPFLADRLGCRCSWEPPIWHLAPVAVGILLLSLWPFMKFRRL